MNSVLVQRGKIIFSESRRCFCRLFKKEDVKDALWKIEGNKVSGSDGYNSLFFKDNWGIVGDEVCAAVFNFFENGKD